MRARLPPGPRPALRGAPGSSSPRAAGKKNAMGGRGVRPTFVDGGTMCAPQSGWCRRAVRGVGVRSCSYCALSRASGPAGKPAICWRTLVPCVRRSIPLLPVQLGMDPRGVAFCLRRPVAVPSWFQAGSSCAGVPGADRFCSPGSARERGQGVRQLHSWTRCRSRQGCLPPRGESTLQRARFPPALSRTLIWIVARYPRIGLHADFLSAAPRHSQVPPRPGLRMCRSVATSRLAGVRFRCGAAGLAWRVSARRYPVPPRSSSGTGSASVPCASTGLRRSRSDAGSGAQRSGTSPYTGLRLRFTG
jgi:hypothetical protein